jgi:hypothetical protein
LLLCSGETIMRRKTTNGTVTLCELWVRSVGVEGNRRLPKIDL